MLNDLLPEKFHALRVDDLNEVARQATKTGDFAQAAAILANGYERGGPPVFMDQAYTYAHYLIISRRMIRRGVAALQWVRGKDILENFSSLHADDLIDRLTPEFAATFKTRQGMKREPSGAMLLQAELRLADGEAAQQIVDTLPHSRSVFTRAQIVTAQAYHAESNPIMAGQALERVLDTEPRNQTALEMAGKLALENGDLDKAADCFDKNLRAIFAPVPEGKIPVGEIHYRSTVLNRFEIYAYCDGYFVIKKQPGLIGVTMVGRNILQVMETRGYRQWSALKRVLSRFIPINRLKALLSPANSDDEIGKVTTGIFQHLYRIYDRMMVLIGADSIRPYIKRIGFAVYPFAAPILSIIKFLLLSLKSPLRVLKRFLRVVASAAFQLVLISWLKAQEVPHQQQVEDADDIFAVVNRMLEEEEKSVAESIA